MRKGTWTPEEDRKLTAYVTRYGCWNWRQLPRFAGLSRCGKSCRLRWMNYLRPNLKRGNYTKEEDELIIKLHESLGNRWSAIAARLPGRTDNEIKNHWHTALSKKGSKQATTTTTSSSSSSSDEDDMNGESSKRRSNKSHSKRLQKNRKRRMSMETDDDDIIPRVRDILESSEFSLLQQPSISESTESSLQPTMSSSESSSPQPSVSEVSNITSATGAMNVFEELLDNFAVPQQIINAESTSGSFWTEPFLTDNYYSNIIHYPSSPFSIDEPMYSYEFYDEHVMIW